MSTLHDLILDEGKLFIMTLFFWVIPNPSFCAAFPHPEDYMASYPNVDAAEKEKQHTPH